MPYLLFFVLFIPLIINAQNKQNKVLEVYKIEKEPEIDGMLDAAIWKNAPAANDFIQYEPFSGKFASFSTKVKLLYNNKGIYVGAKMYDNHPDSIYTELGKRDYRGIKKTSEISELNSDKFSILLNPFNDGINMMEFTVSASGVKSDAKHIGRVTDFNWDGVWRCETRVSDSGWVAEIMIPYSTLRFPSELKSNWGLHLFRNIKRYNEWDTWNYINIEQQNITNQAGELNGILGIDPPLRLSFYPYFSTYVKKQSNREKWINNVRGGLDLKYGINESFTLDMTLIPDFGQVPTEERILSLSPFEVQYEEKRSFFNEGKELFTKYNSTGGILGTPSQEMIFYSKRIGDEPDSIDKAEASITETEKIKENPLETRMVNATKISGRTDNGLGIGVLNVMTSEANALALDTVTGNTREIRTQPFTNYNTVVFDQNLKNNSYVSIINTNVHYFRNDYTGNVTASAFQLANKSNTYQVSGKSAISQRYADNNRYGHAYSLFLSKTEGTFLFELGHKVETDTFDPNALGSNIRNNEFTQQMELQYNIYKPFGIFLDWHTYSILRYSSLYEPRKYQSFEIRLYSAVNYTNLWHSGFLMIWQPSAHDYYEPRVKGWMFQRPQYYLAHFFMGTDDTKDISIEAEASIGNATSDRQGYGFNISPNFRFHDAFSLNCQFEYRQNLNQLSRHIRYREGILNDIGYVEHSGEGENASIIFGEREVETMTNTLESSYKLSPRDLINLRIRHYWKTVEYSNFFPLKSNGKLGYPLGYERHGSSQDLNYNAFTVYLQYLWQFAPGSELSIVWKNNIYTSSQSISKGYVTNLNHILNSPQINSLSIKFIYYINYQEIRRRLKNFRN